MTKLALIYILTMIDLAKKLQIKHGKSWLLYNAPVNYLPSIEPLPNGVQINYEPFGEFDGIQLFIRNSGELSQSLPTIIPLLKPDTIFWLTYPKKSSGLESGLEMMGSWDELSAQGLRIVTSVSVNETWTALRFKPVEQTKVSDYRNDQIPNSLYNNYINVETKQVVLPADVADLLAENQQAMSFYQGLSYSNKKEYVVWILSAKQEKTRTERLAKMLEKLLAGKKNPAEK